ELACGCGLAVHEAFRLTGETPGHGSIHGCLDFAERAGIKALALLHIQREERVLARREIDRCLERSSSPCRAWLPETGETVTF
ncbi:MAG: hypothetical protein OEV73_11890, partial [Desulfobulbaceae bacterium]|nr:hypothetical protein [Desulfobulbaceae bacterium]